MLTQISKLLIKAQRPNHRDYRPFPSGHTGMAFSLAAAISFTHPWYIGVLANIAATSTAISRVEFNQHYLQDVLAGALISYSYAYSIYKKIIKI